MSKLQELDKDKQEKQNTKISTMSSRQQILYLLNKTQEEGFTIDQYSSEDDITVEYSWIEYFNARQKKVQESIPPKIVAERERLTKLSRSYYKPISKNIYKERKKGGFSLDDAYVCSCEKPKRTLFSEEWMNKVDETSEDLYFGCGKDCINKMISWECVEDLCPWGVLCKNRRFQNNETMEIYPMLTENKGWGLYAGQYIPKGSYILQYVGEIYSTDSKYGQLKLNEYRNKSCTYLMSISKNEVIDPTEKGNIARFINHSCDPNCETQKWHVLGEICVGVFAVKDIEEDEELTFNYGFDLFKTVFQKCYCGTSNCKGYLGLVQPEDLNSPNFNVKCDVCSSLCKNSDLLTLCDGCRRVFHKDCLGAKPNTPAYCTYCIKSGMCQKTVENNISDIPFQSISTTTIKEQVKVPVKKKRKNNSKKKSRLSISSRKESLISNLSSKKTISKSKVAIKKRKPSQNIFDKTNSNIDTSTSNIQNDFNKLELNEINTSKSINNENIKSENDIKPKKKPARKKTDKKMNQDESKEITVIKNADLNEKNITNNLSTDNSNLINIKRDDEFSNNNLISENNVKHPNKKRTTKKIQKTNSFNIEIDSNNFNELIINNVYEKVVNQEDNRETHISEAMDSLINTTNELTKNEKNKAENNSTVIEQGGIENKKRNFAVNKKPPKSPKKPKQRTCKNKKNASEENNVNKSINTTNNNDKLSPLTDLEDNYDIKDSEINSSKLMSLNEQNNYQRSIVQNQNNIDNSGGSNVILNEIVIIDESKLKIIKENLKQFISIGARLFWEKSQSNNDSLYSSGNNYSVDSKSSKIEIKIIGNIQQIKKVKSLMFSYINKETIFEKLYSVVVSVPKIFIRRIVGHHDKNIVEYKVKYGVEIDYDKTLISEEIIAVSEQTDIILRGDKTNIDIILLEISNFLQNLKICKINLLSRDFNLVKTSICSLKSIMDPADIRLSRLAISSANRTNISANSVVGSSNSWNNTLSKFSWLINDTNSLQNAFMVNKIICKCDNKSTEINNINSLNTGGSGLNNLNRGNIPIRKEIDNKLSENFICTSIYKYNFGIIDTNENSTKLNIKENKEVYDPFYNCNNLSNEENYEKLLGEIKRGDIKYVNYYHQNSFTKEVIIIGFDSEIQNCISVLKSFLFKQTKNNESVGLFFNYSLKFFPEIKAFKEHYYQYLKSKGTIFRFFESDEFSLSSLFPINYYNLFYQLSYDQNEDASFLQELQNLVNQDKIPNRDVIVSDVKDTIKEYLNSFYCNCNYSNNYKSLIINKHLHSTNYNSVNKKNNFISLYVEGTPINMKETLKTLNNLLEQKYPECFVKEQNLVDQNKVSKLLIDQMALNLLGLKHALSNETSENKDKLKIEIKDELKYNMENLNLRGVLQQLNLISINQKVVFTPDKKIKSIIAKNFDFTSIGMPTISTDNYLYGSIGAEGISFKKRTNKEEIKSLTRNFSNPCITKIIYDFIDETRFLEIINKLSDEMKLISSVVLGLPIMNISQFKHSESMSLTDLHCINNGVVVSVSEIKRSIKTIFNYLSNNLEDIKMNTDNKIVEDMEQYSLNMISEFRDFSLKNNFYTELFSLLISTNYFISQYNTTLRFANNSLYNKYNYDKQYMQNSVINNILSSKNGMLGNISQVDHNLNNTKNALCQINNNSRNDYNNYWSQNQFDANNVYNSGVKLSQDFNINNFCVKSYNESNSHAMFKSPNSEFSINKEYSNIKYVKNKNNQTVIVNSSSSVSQVTSPMMSNSESYNSMCYVNEDENSFNNWYKNNNMNCDSKVVNHKMSNISYQNISTMDAMQNTQIQFDKHLNNSNNCYNNYYSCNFNSIGNMNINISINNKRQFQGATEYSNNNESPYYRNDNSNFKPIKHYYNRNANNIYRDDNPGFSRNLRKHSYRRRVDRPHRNSNSSCNNENGDFTGKKRRTGNSIHRYHQKADNNLSYACSSYNKVDYKEVEELSRNDTQISIESRGLESGVVEKNEKYFSFSTKIGKYQSRYESKHLYASSFDNTDKKTSESSKLDISSKTVESNLKKTNIKDYDEKNKHTITQHDNNNNTELIVTDNNNNVNLQEQNDSVINKDNLNLTDQIAKKEEEKLKNSKNSKLKYSKNSSTLNIDCPQYVEIKERKFDKLDCINEERSVSSSRSKEKRKITIADKKEIKSEQINIKPVKSASSEKEKLTSVAQSTDKPNKLNSLSKPNESNITNNAIKDKKENKDKLDKDNYKYKSNYNNIKKEECSNNNKEKEKYSHSHKYSDTHTVKNRKNKRSKSVSSSRYKNRSNRKGDIQDSKKRDKHNDYDSHDNYSCRSNRRTNRKSKYKSRSRSKNSKKSYKKRRRSESYRSRISKNKRKYSRDKKDYKEKEKEKEKENKDKNCQKKESNNKSPKKISKDEGLVKSKPSEVKVEENNKNIEKPKIITKNDENKLIETPIVNQSSLAESKKDSFEEDYKKPISNILTKTILMSKLSTTVSQNKSKEDKSRVKPDTDVIINDTSKQLDNTDIQLNLNDVKNQIKKSNSKSSKSSREHIYSISVNKKQVKTKADSKEKEFILCNSNNVKEAIDKVNNKVSDLDKKISPENKNKSKVDNTKELSVKKEKRQGSNEKKEIKSTQVEKDKEKVKDKNKESEKHKEEDKRKTTEYPRRDNKRKDSYSKRNSRNRRSINSSSRYSSESSYSRRRTYYKRDRSKSRRADRKRHSRSRSRSRRNYRSRSRRNSFNNRKRRH